MLLRAREFRLLSVQAVLFTPALREKFRVSPFMSTILPRFKDRYDGEPESLPIAPVPQPLTVPEAGVVQIGVKFARPNAVLRSSDGQWEIVSTPERTESRWNATSESESRGEDLPEITAGCLAPLLHYPTGDPEIQIGRMALVVRRWLPQEGAAIALSTAFCLPRLIDEGSPQAALRHSATFRLENLKKYQPDGQPFVNSWVKCSNEEVFDKDSVSVLQDINSLNETAAQTLFTQEQVKQFFSWAPAEMNSILTCYFLNN